MGILGLLLELLVPTLGFAVVGGLVYLLTRALRFRHQDWTLKNPRVSALWAIAAVMIWCTAFVGLVGQLFPSEIASPSVREYDVAEVLTKLAMYAIFVAPSLLLMWLRKESLAGAGVSKHNLGGSLVVGFVLAAIIVFLSVLGSGRSMGQIIGGLGVRHFWALFSYAIVGFGEEFAFRGYLQSRLVIWLGRWRGWGVASVLMALAHVVSRVVFQGEPAIDAFFSSLSIIPVSLLLGYVMLRTENVVAPALAHMFADWILTLG
ncbi:MAG: CPBP family intramembrane metalloprotease [Anaerolineae bacterium]|nr:CPBP family intramembrane metalloprotease [Anaerolineae bacterium]